MVTCIDHERFSEPLLFLLTLLELVVVPLVLLRARLLAASTAVFHRLLRLLWLPLLRYLGLLLLQHHRRRLRVVAVLHLGRGERRETGSRQEGTHTLGDPLHLSSLDKEGHERKSNGHRNKAGMSQL